MRPTTLYRRLPARSRVALSILVTHASSTRESYLAQIPTSQGVYIGEAAVINDRGYCYVMAINTRSHEVNIEIPPQQLQPFDVDMSENFAERIKHMHESLHREHNDGQATEQIKKILEEYHHLFLLKGDPPPRTYLLNNIGIQPRSTQKYKNSLTNS